MIVDSMKNFERYVPVHSGFKSAFDFIQTHPLSQLKDGKYVIDGKRLFALGMAVEGKGKDKAVLETHRDYIDIQYTVSGFDYIGWADASTSTPDDAGYDAEKDVAFYSNPSDFWIKVPAGNFAIFFPHDAHAPLGTDGFIHKVVVKVAVVWDSPT